MVDICPAMSSQRRLAGALGQLFTKCQCQRIFHLSNPGAPRDTRAVAGAAITAWRIIGIVLRQHFTSAAALGAFSGF